jgi:hypothetical protein
MNGGDPDGDGAALVALEARLTVEGAIGAADVLALRRAIYRRDGRIGRDEAACLLRLDRACGAASDPAFAAFLVEALADYYVWGRGRRGLDRAEAGALMAALGPEPEGCGPAGLRLLAKVIAESDGGCPEELRAFALRAVRHGVLRDGGHRGGAPAGDGGGDGGGDIDGGGTRRRPGVIDAADVALIRQIVHGAGGGGGLAISRAEAELLFDLNDRTATGENDPAWGELFVKAITMHVLFGGGSPERVDEPEACWLVERIERDGRAHGHEAALLRYLRREAAALHPALTPLLRRFGVAA